MRIGIIGVGVVGGSVVRILQENQSVISARAGEDIVPVVGAVRSLNKVRDDLKIPLTDDIDQVLNDESIDTIVELMGGIDQAYNIAKRALQMGKRFVTANKALLAHHGYELQEIAGDIPIGFEASVAGGIPIIKALRDGLGANHILEICGILNGTCNYILGKMFHENVPYALALKEAQQLGYAEADPSFDVNGLDTAHKLLILASIAYGIDIRPDDILIEGITEISDDEIAFAKEFGYRIKLLGIAKKRDHQIELRVHPAFVSNQEMVSRVDGVMNGVSVLGDCVGETMYYGPGAGGHATASAVISDLIEIARSKKSPMFGFKKSLDNNFCLRPCDEIRSRYYFKMEVIDKVGVLEQIAKIFGGEGISIDSLLQRNSEQGAKIFLSTHHALEKDAKKALKHLNSANIILSQPFMMRIKE